MTSPRPPGIECVDWVAAAPGTKMCHDYSAPGGCNIPSRGVCEEWLRKNPNSPLAKLVPATTLKRQGISASSPTPANAPPRPPEPPAWPLRQPVVDSGPIKPPPPPEDPYNPAPLALAPVPAPGPPAPPRPLSRAAQRAKDALAAAQGAGLGLSGPSGAPIPTLPVNSSALDPFGEAFEKRLAELEALAGEITLATDYGEIIVSRKPASPRRPREISFREMGYLTTMLSIFPGSRVIAFNEGGVIAEIPEETLVRSVATQGPAQATLTANGSPLTEWLMLRALSLNGVPIPKTHPLREACKCGSSDGYIIEKNGQDVVFCSKCTAYQYCAPRTETDKAFIKDDWED